jgi:hypothetical protein
MVGLFSTASKDSQIGVDFLRDGVAVAQVVFQGSNFDLFQLQRDKRWGLESGFRDCHQWKFQ